MKRIKLVLAAAAVMVAMLAAVSGPAMADNLNCRDVRGALIRCNGDLYRPVNNHHPYYYNNYHRYYYNSYYPYYYWWWFNPFFYNNG